MPLLSEELRVVAPELIQVDVDKKTALYTLEYDGTTMTATFPDSFVVEKLDAIIAAHDPKRDSVNQAAEKRRTQLDATLTAKFLALGFTEEEIGFLYNYLAVKSRN